LSKVKDALDGVRKITTFSIGAMPYLWHFYKRHNRMRARKRLSGSSRENPGQRLSFFIYFCRTRDETRWRVQYKP